MIQIFKGVFLILMLDCEQSARLTSESLDRPLSRSETLALKIHQFCCRSSYRVARQMEMVANALREKDVDELQGTADHMPDDARERIRNELRLLSESE